MDELIKKLEKEGFVEFQDFEIYNDDLYVSFEVSNWIKENSPTDMFFCSVWS